MRRHCQLLKICEASSNIVMRNAARSARGNTWLRARVREHCVSGERISSRIIDFSTGLLCSQWAKQHRVSLSNAAGGVRELKIWLGAVKWLERSCGLWGLLPAMLLPPPLVMLFAPHALCVCVCVDIGKVIKSIDWNVASLLQRRRRHTVHLIAHVDRGTKPLVAWRGFFFPHCASPNEVGRGNESHTCSAITKLTSLTSRERN